MESENMLTICEKHEPRATVLHRGAGCPLCEFDPGPQEESLGIVEALGVLRSLMSSDRRGADGSPRAEDRKDNSAGWARGVGSGLVLCSGGCGQWIPYQYCDDCAKSAKCPHGNPLDCNDCMVEGDLAYDAGRE